MEPIVVIIIGIIVLGIVIKFWQFFVGATIIGGIVIGGLWAVEQSSSSSPSSSSSSYRHQTAPTQVTKALPDLVITSVWREPNDSFVEPGTTVRLFFKVLNQGKAAYGGNFLVSGSGNYSGMVRDGLQPSESKIAVIDYPVYSRNTRYTLNFTVDGGMVVDESNENNNESGAIIITTLP